MPDRFTPLQPGTDPTQQMAMINNNFAKLDNETTTKLYYNAQGNTGLIEGQLPNDLGTGTLIYDQNGVPLIGMYVDASGNPVLKVASAGSDVTTASNANLIFNSSQDIFKIVQSGTMTITNPGVSAPGGGGWASASNSSSVNHGLGFTPVVLAFLQVGSYYYQLPQISNVVLSATSVELNTISIGTNSSQVTATYSTVAQLGIGSSISGGTTSTIKYYLLQETAN